MQLTKPMVRNLSLAADRYLIRQEIAFIFLQRPASGMSQVNLAPTFTFICVKFCFNIILWHLDPFLGSDSVNTFPQ
jgi:hypothetical protein